MQLSWALTLLASLLVATAPALATAFIDTGSPQTEAAQLLHTSSLRLLQAADGDARERRDDDRTRRDDDRTRRNDDRTRREDDRTRRPRGSPAGPPSGPPAGPPAGPPPAPKPPSGDDCDTDLDCFYVRSPDNYAEIDLECGPGGTCVECHSDEQCDVPFPYCQLDTGTCGECRDNRDCLTDEYPTCVFNDVTQDGTRKTCTECEFDQECAGSRLSLSSGSDTEVCNQRFRCVECREDSQCANTQNRPICDTILGICQQCLEHEDCDGSPFGDVCDRSNYRCGPAEDACTSDAYCRVTNHPDRGDFCFSGPLIFPGVCVECRPGVDSDCADSDIGPICADYGKCRGCQEDVECEGNPGGPICTGGEFFDFGQCIKT